MKPDRLLSLRWAMSLAALLVFAFAVQPAAAQRGRTGGERKTETEETRREPEKKPETRQTPERPRGRSSEAPAPRREPQAQPAPRPAPQAQPAPAPRETERTTPGRTTEPPRARTEAPRDTGRARTETPRQTTPGRQVPPRQTTPERQTTPGRADNGGRAPSARTERQPEPQRGTTGSTGRSTGGDRQGRVVAGTGRSTGSRVDRRPQPSRVQRDRYRWVHVPAVPQGGYRYRPAVPVIRLEFEWPWEYRYRRAWSPRYRYRQVVYVESGYGYDRWTSRLDVRTIYRQRVRSASHNRAELDLDIEAVEIYQDGQYLGRVTRIPDRFGRVRATVHRDGRLTFDRDVFVVGSREAGFEIVSTRHYGGYFLSDWRRGDRMEVGRLDLRRNRVQRVNYSRLLDYDGYRGYAPVSLLPEDERWLGDYGPFAVSTFAYDDDFYDDFGYDDGYYYGYGAGVQPQRGLAPRGQSSTPISPMLQGTSDDTYQTPAGARIRLQREAEIQRIE